MARDYFNRAYVCPYMKTARATSIRCEEGGMAFSCKEDAKAHVERFCCRRWQECPVAKRLNKYYERKYRMQ